MANQKGPRSTSPVPGSNKPSASGLLPRFHKLAPEKRARILDVATREFTERGFTNASLNRIIEGAGISKGAMYYYFHDKAHLYLAILENAFNQLLEEQPMPDLAQLSKETFWQDVEAHATALFEYYQHRPDLIRLIRTAHDLRSNPHAPSLDQLREIGKDWIGKIIARGQELGAIRRDIPFEMMLNIWASIDSVADSWLIEHWDELGEAQRRAHMPLLMDLFKRMWSPDYPTAS